MMIKSLASANPPAGLDVNKVPLFIGIGFDDNGYSGLKTPNEKGGLKWAAEMFRSLKNPAGTGNAKTFDGMKGRASFYFSTMYIGETRADHPYYVKKMWHDTFAMGHEAGNHTHMHYRSGSYSPVCFGSEIDICFNWLKKPVPSEKVNDPNGDFSKGAGIDPSFITGFRSPFLEYNDDLFQVVKDKGLKYDCSVQQGFQQDQDGTNYFWPYTLDNGNPGYEDNVSVPGLWEMPVYMLNIPGDDLCEKYGTKPGLQVKLKGSSSRNPFNDDVTKIVGLDWDLFAAQNLTKAECLAILKYSLDLRIKGNRCPFLFGAHSDLYSEGNPFPPNISAPERREMMEEFLDYALSYDFVRVVAHEDVVNWMNDPVALG